MDPGEDQREELEDDADQAEREREERAQATDRAPGRQEHHQHLQDADQRRDDERAKWPGGGVRDQRLAREEQDPDDRHVEQEGAEGEREKHPALLVVHRREEARWRRQNAEEVERERASQEHHRDKERAGEVAQIRQLWVDGEIGEEHRLQAQDGEDEVGDDDDHASDEVEHVGDDDLSHPGGVDLRLFGLRWLNWRAHSGGRPARRNAIVGAVGGDAVRRSGLHGPR